MVFGTVFHRILLVVLAAFVICAFIVSWWRTGGNFALKAAQSWVLVGGVTDSSASFRIRNGASVTVSTKETLVDPVFSSAIDIDDDMVASVDVTNVLAANTEYFYQVVTRKNEDILTGSFRTSVPDGTKFNFTIATAGCAWTGSRSPMFVRLLDFDLQFFLQLGDFHYEDIGINDAKVRADAVSKALGSPEQARFYRNTPLVYMWDDHDWLGNNAGANSELEDGAAATAKASYRLLFPHQTLYHANTSTAAVFHAFTVGTVRFILSDLRSESTETSIFSQEQSDWLRQEFSQADTYDFVIWVTSKPWIGPAEVGDDAWFGKMEDRALVSDWINAHTNILAISADAHMLAFDNGSNTNYGINATSSFPILQSGPMDNVGTVKGGPFSSGCHAYGRERNSQFSVIRFEFTETSNCIFIEGYRVEDTDTAIVLEETLCGPDITAPVATMPVGSCKIPRFRKSTAALLSLSVIVTITCLGLACYIRDVYAGFLIFVGYAATFVLGIATPFARGVKTLDLWPTFTILLVQSGAVLFLLVMQSRKEAQHTKPKSHPNTND